MRIGLRVAVLGAAALAGAYLWASQLLFGAPALMTWMDFTRAGFYHAAVVESLRTWQLPLYYPAGIDGEWTNYYWAHPDTPLVPWVPLLAVVDSAPWLLAQLLAFYAIGVAGVLALARDLRLSLVPTLFLGIVSLANGYLLARWSSGQTDTVAYFWFPWVWCAVLRFVDGRPVSVGAFGALLACALLTGATHMVLWCSYVLALVFVFRPAARWSIAGACSWFVLLAAIKLVPSLTVYPLAAVSHMPWMGGLPSWSYAWATLTDPTLTGPGGSPYARPFWWEYTGFLGTTATVIVLAGGLVGCWRRPLCVVLLAPFVYALAGNLWAPIRDAGLPFIGGERIPARMLIVPLTLLATLASAEMETALAATWRDRHRLGDLVAAFAAPLLFVLLPATELWHFAATIRPTPPIDARLEIPAPHLPATPGGTWGVMPIVALPDVVAATPAQQPVTYVDIYRRAIALGTLLSVGAWVLFVREVRPRLKWLVVLAAIACGGCAAGRIHPNGTVECVALGKAGCRLERDGAASITGGTISGNLGDVLAAAIAALGAYFGGL